MQKYLTSLVIGLALLSPGFLWADTPAKPTDPQIAHIAYTAGLIDVEAGKLAREKSQDDGTTLIPDAQNSELKSLLQNGLEVFQAHLEHAERLAQQLASAKKS